MADIRAARDALDGLDVHGTRTGTGKEDAECGQIAIATAADRRAQDEERVGSPAESSPRLEPAPVHPHSRYPLNSRRLTAWHLRALAQALGLPTTGSADQLRQCIEGIVQRDHDYQNVVVIIRESLKTEHVVVLADSEGEFLEGETIYRDPPPRRMWAEEDVRVTEELRETRRQLEEANHIIESATAKDGEQAQTIAQLQEESEVEATQACEGLATLKRQLAAEKEKARKSWKTNCEHLVNRTPLSQPKRRSWPHSSTRLSSSRPKSQGKETGAKLHHWEQDHPDPQIATTRWRMTHFRPATMLRTHCLIHVRHPLELACPLPQLMPL